MRLKKGFCLQEPIKGFVVIMLKAPVEGAFLFGAELLFFQVINQNNFHNGTTKSFK